MPSAVDDSGVDLSFSSNDSTLVDSPRTCDTSPGSLIADVSESHKKPCSRCRKTEGESFLDGTPVIFDFKKNGKRCSRCRRCLHYANEKQNPISNPINNPINNRKVSFTPNILPRMFPMCKPPFWCCIGFWRGIGFGILLMILGFTKGQAGLWKSSNHLRADCTPGIWTWFTWKYSIAHSTQARKRGAPQGN